MVVWHADGHALQQLALRAIDACLRCRLADVVCEPAAQQLDARRSALRHLGHDVRRQLLQLLIRQRAAVARQLLTDQQLPDCRSLRLGDLDRLLRLPSTGRATAGALRVIFAQETRGERCAGALSAA